MTEKPITNDNAIRNQELIKSMETSQSIERIDSKMDVAFKFLKDRRIKEPKSLREK